MTPARNDPCPCGSGRKYKTCCGRAGGDAVPTPHAHAEGVRQAAQLLEAGRFGELEVAARALLDAQPRSGIAWQLLAVALGRQGRDTTAALTEAAALSRADATPHLNLGNALARAGRLEEAAVSLRRALAIRPDFVEAFVNLAGVQLELGQAGEALASCERALAIRPEFAPAHEARGAALLWLGKIDEAVASCRRAVALEPGSAGAHNGLGAALLRAARVGDAIASFRRALALDAGSAETHANLASAERRVGELDQAAAGFRRALRLAPRSSRLHAERATTLRLQRRSLEAETACRDALELDPASAQTFTVLAELRADAGDFAAADALFKHAAEIDASSAEAWAGMARTRRMTPDDAGWQRAVSALAEAGLSPQRESVLRYALGKYHDDVGQPDAAFRNYRRANELARQSGPAYDRRALTRTVDLIIASHNRRWVTCPRAGASASTLPLFVVGMLRSGTSLAEQILASHPGVFGAGELMFWGANSAAAIQRALAQGVHAIAVDDATLDALGRNYVALLRAQSADSLRVVDKLPTNFFLLGLIHAALPNARVIHMQRHPIDTCLSIYFQHFEAVNSYANDLEDLAHYYREYTRLMRHWRSVLPAGTMLDVPYERLVADPEPWTRRLVEFAGVPWDARCLEPQHASRTVITASKWQVRQPISTQSVDRWRRYERFIAPLLPLLESNPD